MYVVSKSQRGSDIPNDPDHPTFHFFLHAIDVTTGEDRPNSPVEITGQVSGTSGTVFDPILHPNGDINGFGSNDGKGHVIFVPRYHNNRVSLLLVNGTIYIGFASQEDAFEHHGWIFAYDSITLEQKNIFCTTPDFAPPDFRPEGGIWQSGFGLSTDGKAIYCTVGNGSFNANIGGADYGDSVLKLSLDLTLLSFFTPAAQDAMRRSDNDLGSGGVLIIPQQQGSSSNLLVTAGKDGEVFLLDRNNLGGYSGPQGITQGLVYLTNNNALFPTVTRPGVTAMQAQGDNSPGVWGGPAYYNGPFGPFIFYCSNGQDGNSKNLVRFNLANNALIRPMSGAMVDPKSQDATNVFFLGGGTPIVSSDQSSTGTGILWVIKRGDNNNNQIPSNIRLLAYDATDLSTPLQNIQYGRWGTPAAAPNKTGGRAFIEPTVINGRVYVSHLDNNSNNFFISVFSL